jgi:prepilin-type N-terminal cleavage/methylation domain-containing protein
MRMLARLRDRLHSHEGMTLVELLVTTSLLSVVSVIFLSIMISVQRGVDFQIDRSNDNDQARLAVQQLDREIRSGNVLYNPNNTAYLSAGTAAGYGLLVYTQNNANIRNPGNRCVQWRVIDQQLQTRNWATGDPNDTVSPWRVVAENVVNATLPASSGGPVPAFVLDTDPNKGSRIVNVTIVTQTDADSGDPVRISASLTGRNTSYGYPLSVCAAVPAP